MARVTIILLASIALLACTATSQRGNVQRANGRLAKSDYTGAISLAEFAISQGDAAPEAQLQARFVKAQALEGLGRTEEAIGVYEYIVDSHPGTPSAYQARGRLAALGELCPENPQRVDVED